ncbi:MAG: hypothetical protein ACYCZ7_01970 [Minisyncoccota bacterium]
MNRKVFIIATIIITVVLTGVGAYFFYFKKTSPMPSPSGVAFPGEGLPVTSVTGSTPGTEEGVGGEVFVPGSGTPLPRLYELHELPVAGVGFIETKDKKGAVLATSARYIERGLGHIYETSLATYTESRIGNETRSRLSEALWGNNGKSVVVRFLDEEGVIKTRILNIGVSAASSIQNTAPEASEILATEEIFLPDFIPFMAVAEDSTDKLFYLENGNVSSTGNVVTFKNTGVTRIFTSSFTEWLPQFPNQKLVTLTTKPSANVPGHLFFVDTKTKSLTKILSNINGLTTLTSRDGASVLYAETKEGTPELLVYEIAKKESHSLALQTLPEKCAWSAKNTAIAYCAVPQTLPSAQYPDQWYQGLISFSDTIWRIDTKTSVVEKILTPADLRAPALDIVNLVLSSDDAQLLFINKVTGTPWVFQIIPKAPVITSTPSATPTTSVTEGMQKLR